MVGNGTAINGDIQSKSDIRIDGTLKGSVKTEGKLLLGLPVSLREMWFVLM